MFIQKKKNSRFPLISSIGRAKFPSERQMLTPLTTSITCFASLPKMTNFISKDLAVKIAKQVALTSAHKNLDGFFFSSSKKEILL